MNDKEFKETIKKYLQQEGFKYKKRNFYYSKEDLIAIVNLQKSNYVNTYYINYAFTVKNLHENVDFPDRKDWDILGRFRYYFNETIEFDFQPELTTPDLLIKNLERNIEEVIQPVIREGIKRYFELYPIAIHAASLRLKKYLKL